MLLLRFHKICVSVPPSRGRRYQDEAGVVSVPPVEGGHTDFWVTVVMENLASAVGVATENEAGLKPLQQL